MLLKSLFLPIQRMHREDKTSVIFPVAPFGVHIPFCFFHWKKKKEYSKPLKNKLYIFDIQYFYKMWDYGFWLFKCARVDCTQIEKINMHEMYNAHA